MLNPICNGGGEVDVRQFREDGTVVSQTNKPHSTVEQYTTP